METWKALCGECNELYDTESSKADEAKGSECPECGDSQPLIGTERALRVMGSWA